MKRYLVVLMRNPGFDTNLIPAHIAFLDKLRERKQIELAGGFSDASGGAYLLLAKDLHTAKALAFDDPLHTSDASSVTVHEWNAQ